MDLFLRFLEMENKPQQTETGKRNFRNGCYTSEFSINMKVGLVIAINKYRDIDYKLNKIEITFDNTIHFNFLLEFPIPPNQHEDYKTIHQRKLDTKNN